MPRTVHEWSDARLNDLAATLEPVPTRVAALTEAVARLTDENRALRAELASMQRQLLQVAWGLVAALIAAAAALASALH
jgi:hypothetical protein